MEFCRRYGFIKAAYLIAILIIGQSDGRELRPSEHGLAYQNSTTKTTGKKSPEMMSFFGGSVSSASNVPFPEAKNMSDSWWSDYGGGRRGEGRDHVRQVLVVASLIHVLSLFSRILI
ncbi:hypothetical protein F0562_013618 [Nyssa sinensis]|uniref:Uncharacterized protein n=1 Tax=Nyssa sinensis TaxID=561372 RepID=A0A5J4ZPE9_9ASTE|nr:hypothetical protein F0562_013618 [Nyssa sinensis]